jgi:penicillin-binding protein 1C
MGGPHRTLRIAGLVLLAFVGTIFALDRVFPPDLSRLARSSAMVLDAEDRLLRAFTTPDGLWRLRTRPAQVDPLYLAMLLAYEDQRFRMHPGVDPLAAARALRQLIANGRIVSGASTITMQTARLLEPRSRSFASKIVESVRALQLEARFGKDEILSMYLTLAPFGGNLEGVHATSRAYFGKPPARLTPGEAALLVALPQSPTRLRPDRFPDRARAARDRVLALMERKGVLTAQQAKEAREEVIPATRHALPFRAPHLARRLANANPEIMAHRTTIDGELQAALEDLLRLEQAELQPKATLAAIVVDNASRKVLAYAGSSDFFDAERAGQIDMVRAVRSPGSTLKPFIYAMAFDALLIHPETIVVDQPTRFGGYRPENFLRAYHGEVTVRTALQQSLNIPAVAVLERVDPVRFAARLRMAGVPVRFSGRTEKPGLPLALGGLGVSLYELATLYTALANGGDARPLLVTRDQKTDQPEGAMLLGALGAWYVTRILEDAPLPENFLPPENRKQPRRIAYKTGTSYGFRDAWAVGYDGRYTVGVWVGRPDGVPSPDTFGRATAAPRLFRVFGLLPESAKPPMPERPKAAITARNAELPERLRRFAGKGATPAQQAGLGKALTQPLVIAFPPDGAVLDLERAGKDLKPLPLMAEGGTKPFNWLVNGKAVASAPHRRSASWQPDGEGFVQITIIDGKGRIARAEALLR